MRSRLATYSGDGPIPLLFFFCARAPYKSLAWNLNKFAWNLHKSRKIFSGIFFFFWHVHSLELWEIFVRFNFFPLHWLQLSIDSSEASGKIFSLFAQSEGPSNDVFLKIEKKNESGLKLTHNIIKFKFNRMIALFKFDFYVI